MTALMQSNGTVEHWTDEKHGRDIFFPEQMIDFGDKAKLRGGAPTCCPRFGPKTTDGPYAGIDMPQHGLVRDCVITDGKPGPKNQAARQDEPAPAPFSDNGVFTKFLFFEPWPHQAQVSMGTQFSERDGVSSLFHTIDLGNEHTDGIPFSLGFHPYFATNDKPFVIRNGPELVEGAWHGGEEWQYEDLDPAGSFIGLKLYSRHCLLELDHGTVEVCVIDGYNDFCVWSDRPDLYICVEPVLHSAGSMPLMLKPGQSQRSQCVLHYKPKAA